MVDNKEQLQLTWLMRDVWSETYFGSPLWPEILDWAEEELMRFLDTMAVRDRLIILSWYGVDRPKLSLREIGGKINLSAERVRCLRDKVIRELQRLMKTSFQAKAVSDVAQGERHSNLSDFRQYACAALTGLLSHKELLSGGSSLRAYVVESTDIVKLAFSIAHDMFVEQQSRWKVKLSTVKCNNNTAHVMPITAIELSTRSMSTMRCLGITTLGELCSRTKHDLLEVRGFGKTSLREVESRLAEKGLHLRSGSVEKDVLCDD